MQIFEEKLLSSEIPKHLDNFRQNNKYWDERKTTEELNIIDNKRVDIALQAEKKCRKLCTGKVPYAPEDIQRLGREICLWSMIIQKKGGRKVSSKLIVRQAKKLKIRYHMKLLQDAIK